MDASPSPTLGSNLLRPRRSLARRWVIIVSMIVHAGAIGAYIVVGMLRIERLKPERGRISVAVGLQLPDTGGGPEPGSKPKDPPKPKTEKPKIKVEELTQPTEDKSKISTEGQTPTTSAIPGSGSGSGAGSGSGSGSAQRPPGDCVGDECPTSTEVKVVEKPKPKTKEMTPPDFKALRKTPDEQTKIQPSNVTKTQMMHAGKDFVQGMIRACIDDKGRVISARVKASTGYPDYDELFAEGVRTWDYRPAIQDGVAIGACGNVYFSFKMTTK